MKQPVSITINRLQHAGIPVIDIVVSEAFYRRLGFSNVMQSGFIMDEEEGTCVMMENNGVVIELYQLPAGKLDAIRNRRDGRIDHIAFDVDNIDTVFDTLKTAGFSIFEEAPVFLSFWEKGCRYFNIAGPDGERLEFNEIVK